MALDMYEPLIYHCAKHKEVDEMITMHPGKYLKMAYIGPGRLSQSELSERTGFSCAALSRVLNGKSDISVVMALRLERALDRSAESWLKMQMDFNLEVARVEEGIFNFHELT